MKKKIVIAVNKEVNPYSMVLNAVGHMLVGVGPRIPAGKMPSIAIIQTNQKGCRDFRTAAKSLHHKLGDTASVFSDFAHTTTQGTARDHYVATSKIEEKDINYYASCICADSNVIDDFLNDLSSQIELQTFKAPNLVEVGDRADFQFSPVIEYQQGDDFTNDENGFSFLLHPKESFNAAIYQFAVNCISLASKQKREDMRLRNYRDLSGDNHPGMSEYGLVVLKGKNESKIDGMRQAAEAEANVAVEVLQAPNNSSASAQAQSAKLLAVGLFGDRQKIKTVTGKNAQLYVPKMDDSCFEPALVP